MPISYPTLKGGARNPFMWGKKLIYVGQEVHLCEARNPFRLSNNSIIISATIYSTNFSLVIYNDKMMMALAFNRSYLKPPLQIPIILNVIKCCIRIIHPFWNAIYFFQLVSLRFQLIFCIRKYHIGR